LHIKNVYAAVDKFFFMNTKNTVVRTPISGLKRQQPKFKNTQQKKTRKHCG